MSDKLSLNEIGPLGTKVEKVIQNLRDGGPDVDEQAVISFVAGTLDEENAERVQVAIFTWKAWFDTYLEWREAAVADEFDEPDSQVVQPKTASRRFGKYPLAVACVLLLFVAATPVFLGRSTIVDGGQKIAFSLFGIGGTDNLPFSTQVTRCLATTSMPATAATFFSDTLGGTRGTEESGLFMPDRTFVQEQSVHLKWQAFGEYDTYSVRIRKLGEDSAQTHATSEMSLQVPLDRGETYEWRVTGVRSGEEFVPPDYTNRWAVFRILNENEQQNVEKQLAEAGDFHLARAYVFAEAGLVSDARSELDKLIQENPDSERLKELRESLK